MRVDALNQINQIYNAKGKIRTNRVTHAADRDKVEISSLGKDLQIAKQAVSEAPDVRMEKIADIKSRMEQGTYHVSAEMFADKMLEHIG